MDKSLYKNGFVSVNGINLDNTVKLKICLKSRQISVTNGFYMFIV